MTASRRVWERLDAENLDAGLGDVVEALTRLLAGAQAGAVSDTDAYLAAVLKNLNITDAPMGALNASGFVGVASDGRDLDGLLRQPVVAAKVATAKGYSPTAGKALGKGVLDRIVATQVADAGRAAEHVGIAVRKNVTGYVRMVNLPACSRCIILAGKFYRYNQGFKRHPQCDCRHIPATEDVSHDLRTNPQAAVAAGQVKGLTDGQRQAIEAGADLNQVVNSRRGMSDAGTTTEGATRRGIYGSQNSQGIARINYTKAPVRLTPDRIIAESGSRDEAFSLLKLYKYIV